MHSKDNEATFQVNIVVKHSKGKYNQDGIKHFAYAVYGVNIPLKNTFKEYRKRWNKIKLQTNEPKVRTRTSTKKPELRLL
ncbi:MAG: hypothetical protein LBB45_08195 [Methanobrevibacter sp.]|jgi:putative transposase|nr:hypothetical protein [Candidatus Methanovirga basalitermitum]